ncbi:MAG: GNAT family N-acetyltransferase [Lachnospiraceae bacterium]|nr:GNAT family N-acetyltransferase [Lachnospiraceae bacterium]
MKEFEYNLIENKLTARDFLRLKVATGFRDRPIDQVEKALKNNLFDVIAVYNDEVIGMGRLVGDGVMYWYLQEIIVLPEFQGKGIGTRIVNRLLGYIEENTTPGTFVSVGLTAAAGKDTFYEQFGFSKSMGMTKYIER